MIHKEYLRALRTKQHWTPLTHLMGKKVIFHKSKTVNIAHVAHVHNIIESFIIKKQIPDYTCLKLWSIHPDRYSTGEQLLFTIERKKCICWFVKLTRTLKQRSCCYDDRMGAILFSISANYLISCWVLLVQVSCMETTIRFTIQTLHFFLFLWLWGQQHSLFRQVRAFGEWNGNLKSTLNI